MKARSIAESLFVTLTALAASLALFGLFMLPFRRLSGSGDIGFLSDLYYNLFDGAFGGNILWEDTLTRAAPLILTALCIALPARLGLIVIGGEGALLWEGWPRPARGFSCKPVLRWSISWEWPSAG